MQENCQEIIDKKIHLENRNEITKKTDQFLEWKFTDNLLNYSYYNRKNVFAKNNFY